MSTFFAEKITDYSCNFDLLEESITGKAGASNYFVWLKDKYRAYFASASGDQKNKFIIRYYRAKKLIYSSAQMFTEAKCVKDKECVVAYYYLCYYALFQAMQANLMICTAYDDQKVLMLSHDNVRIYFDEQFCRNRKCPVNSDIVNQLDKLREFREYYSYAMPFNLAKAAIIDDSLIEKMIKMCCQLLNFRLFVIYQEVARKIDLDISCQQSLKKYLLESCNRLGNNRVFHDDADADFWEELIRYRGAEIFPISLSFEHDFDEYGTYDADVYDKLKMTRTGAMTSKALSFIYSVI